MAEARTASPNRTVDQARALFAYRAIEARKGSDQSKYKTLVKGLGTMTLQNGLGQALAFLLANGGDPGKALYGTLGDWLSGPPDGDHPERVYSAGELIVRLTEGDRHAYQRAQRSTLALCGWLSKFADALLEGKVER